MTLSTPHRQPQPGRAGSVDAIDHRIVPVLERIDAAFLIDHRVAMKTGRDQIGLSRSGKQVTGQLLDSELVERHIVVDGSQYPIAVRPNRTWAILFIAIGIGITGQV